jgi:hypothetical protein
MTPPPDQAAPPPSDEAAPPPADEAAPPPSEEAAPPPAEEAAPAPADEPAPEPAADEPRAYPDKTVAPADTNPDEKAPKGEGRAHYDQEQNDDNTTNF